MDTDRAIRQYRQISKTQITILEPSAPFIEYRDCGYETYRVTFLFIYQSRLSANDVPMRIRNWHSPAFELIGCI
jgi:hypothetical protein